MRTSMGTSIKQIKHPYIIRDREIRGGVPIIAGTGVRVIDIAVRMEKRLGLKRNET